MGVAAAAHRGVCEVGAEAGGARRAYGRPGPRRSRTAALAATARACVTSNRSGAQRHRGLHRLDGQRHDRTGRLPSNGRPAARGWLPDGRMGGYLGTEGSMRFRRKFGYIKVTIGYSLVT